MLDALAMLGAAAASLSGLACAMTAFNLLTWPQGQANTSPTAASRTVSVLIPARNEQDTIRACVEAALQSDLSPLEVIVYDDGSTDQTPQILAEIAAADPRLRVVRGHGLPEGWIGKPHACHQLSTHARGELLLFVDADTFLTPSGLSRVLSMLDTLRADVLTAVPRQLMGSWAEHLVLPLLHLTYTSWFPLMLTYKSDDVRFLAANGQIMAITRQAYDASGGFAAVRHEVVDDMAICRLLKSSGFKVVFADGDKIASCRMYGNARQVWEGFSKNIYEGLGGHIPALIGVIGLYALAFIAPYILAPALLLTHHPGASFAVLALVINLVLRVMLALRHHHHPLGVLAHPLGVFGLLAIAVNSAIWHHRGQIRWSGRTYQAKLKRATLEADDAANADEIHEHHLS